MNRYSAVLLLACPAVCVAQAPKINGGAVPAFTQAEAAQDGLKKPFNWPVIDSIEGGIQFSLRTRWSDGILQYVAILTDSKGRVAKYFLRHPDTDPIPLASFHVTFFDEAGFRLYAIYIKDRDFSKTEGTANFEADGESECAEKIYRAALKAAQAVPADRTTIALSFPTELLKADARPSKKR